MSGTRIRLTRATTANRLAYTPVNGEPVFDYQEKKLYIGDGSTPGGWLIGTMVDLNLPAYESLYKDSDFSALNDKVYVICTTGDPVRCLLPASPNLGDQIRLIDVCGDFGTNNLTLDRNGNLIEELSSDYTINTPGAYIAYYGTNGIIDSWYIIEESGIGWFDDHHQIFRPVHKTGNYLAEPWDLILADTLGGSFIVTLPNDADLGDKLQITDHKNNFGTNPLTVTSTELIDSSTNDKILSVDGTDITFTYTIDAEGVIGWISTLGIEDLDLDGLPYNPITVISATDVKHGDVVLADSSGGSFNITLPAGPMNGDCIRVIDVAGSAEINNFTILRNGKTIDGLAEDMIFDMNKAHIMFIYYSVNNDWHLSLIDITRNR